MLRADQFIEFIFTRWSPEISFFLAGGLKLTTAWIAITTAVIKSPFHLYSRSSNLLHFKIPISNENGAVLLRIRLSSTLQRRKRSPKTEPFENALQSGVIWKRCFLKTLFSSVDCENDAIWKRWRHQNHSTVSLQNGGQALPCRFILRQFRGPIYWNAHASSSFDHAHWGYNSVFKQIRRCSVDGRKRYENDKCGRKSFWKQSKTAPFSFENGLVWTGPKSTWPTASCFHQFSRV